METISFGDTGTDKITGFTGVCTGRCSYITGCAQVLLAPKATSGEYKEPRWFDEQRVERDHDVARVVLDNGDTPGADVAAPVR